MDVATVTRMRDLLREMEAKLDATPRAPAHTRLWDERRALARQVHTLRGTWRAQETAIGRRTAGMGVGGHHVNREDTHKLSALTKGYRKAAQRNTGKSISGDIADFEMRVKQLFGFDPGTKAG